MPFWMYFSSCSRQPAVSIPFHKLWKSISRGLTLEWAVLTIRLNIQSVLFFFCQALHYCANHCTCIYTDISICFQLSTQTSIPSLWAADEHRGALSSYKTDISLRGDWRQDRKKHLLVYFHDLRCMFLPAKTITSYCRFQCRWKHL